MHSALVPRPCHCCIRGTPIRCSLHAFRAVPLHRQSTTRSGLVTGDSAAPSGGSAMMTFDPSPFANLVFVWLTLQATGKQIQRTRIDLFWLPLGAGGRFVRSNGRVYERMSAHRHHRPVSDLHHTGLLLRLDNVSYAEEMGPAWNVSDAKRGVVREGPVGFKWLGRFRAFRYEIRCWPGGYIPDVAEAVKSPVRVTEDPTRVAALLAVLKEVPALTWGRGRDQLGTGEMRAPDRVTRSRGHASRGAYMMIVTPTRQMSAPVMS